MLSAPYVARSYAERHRAGHRLGGRPQAALSRPEGAALAAARSGSRLPRRLPSAKQGSERNVSARSSAGASAPGPGQGGDTALESGRRDPAPVGYCACPVPANTGQDSRSCPAHSSPYTYLQGAPWKPTRVCHMHAGIPPKWTHLWDCVTSA
ncbi:unnamed protein product [Caretta caretta]